MWRRLSLSYWLFRVAEAVVGRISPRWASRLAVALGSAAYVLNRRARQTAQENIRPVVGKNVAATARYMFVHNAEYYLSLFTPRPPAMSLDEHDLQGWEHFRQALARGRGCLLVSPHLGDINYYAELFVASGLKVNVLVEDLQPRRLSELVARLRARRGVNVIIGGPGALRQIYRALDRNEIVGVISDRDVGGDGLPVTFFGLPARMPAMAFTIGARRKTPVVFGTAVRTPSGTIVADVAEPFVPTNDNEAQVQRMAGVFEGYIRRFPEHWLAFQPIFGVSQGRHG